MVSLNLPVNLDAFSTLFSYSTVYIENSFLIIILLEIDDSEEEPNKLKARKNKGHRHV